MGLVILAAGYLYNHPQSTVRQAAVTTALPAELPPAEISDTTAPAEAVFSDTLHLPNGVVVRLEPISRETFEASPPTQQVTLAGENARAGLPTEKQQIALDSARVKRDGLSLLLKPEQGPLIKLTDSAPDSAENEYYLYLTTVPGTRHWLVDMLLDGEVGYYLLVDQRTGDRDTLIQYPVLSPSRNLIACGVTSGSAGYGPEGLELWHKTEQGEFARSWYREIPGVSEVRWENDHTLLLFQEYVAGMPDAKRRYVRLRLPK